MGFLRFSPLLLIALLISIILPFSDAFADAMYSGSINRTNRYAWSENAGWIDFGTTAGMVRVMDSVLTGYAWSENLGWISLNCSNDSSCSTVDFKVTNNGEGVLGGYAWSENAGWIQFAPTNGGVTIDSSGVFSGYAWGENTGWIVFNCSNESSCGTVDYKVVTHWRPDDDESSSSSSSSSAVATPSGGRGGCRGSNCSGRGGSVPVLDPIARRGIIEPEERASPTQSPPAVGKNEESMPWTDFNSQHPYADAAIALFHAGILKGNGDGTVSLDSLISRAEAITLLFRARGDEDQSDIVVPLADVREETWYSPALRTLYAADIVSGYGDGLFRPGVTLTLSQALKLITIALGLASEEDQDNALQWYDPYVIAGREEGLITGEIDPEREVTRGEFVEWLARVLENS